MNDHERNCEFRLVFCVSSSCQESLIFKDLLKHKKEEKHDHSEVLYLKSGFTFLDWFEGTEDAKDGVSWKMDQTKIDGRIFWIVNLVQNHAFHFALIYNGSPDEADNLECEFHYETGRLRNNFRCQVYTPDVKFEEMMTSYPTFTVPTIIMKKLEEAEVGIGFKVINLKEEMNDDAESGVSEN